MKKGALEGVKVADFGWAVAGPWLAKFLADHGAQVIHIESRTRVDLLRTIAPFKDRISGINRSGYFASYNNNKYGITLNLIHRRGLEIAKRIVAWADVAVESFSPGTMKRLGLGYEELNKVNPKLVMISSSNLGQSGPRASHPGIGVQLTGLSGLVHLTGWPDRGPVVIYGAYTDAIAAFFGATAVTAALGYVRRTGKGLYIDLSQYEASVYFLMPLVLDFVVNRRITNRTGNRSPCAAPHGAYPCRGQDRWCAIAVFTDEEWRSFCRVLGDPEWTKEPKFATLRGRKENEDELDTLIAQWTVNFVAGDVMAKMQSAGVKAGVLQTSEDLFNDPQLQYRRHFWQLMHQEIGEHSYFTPAFKLSKTPVELQKPAPCLGEDNEFVYTHILGMSDDEFVELLGEGVFD